MTEHIHQCTNWCKTCSAKRQMLNCHTWSCTSIFRLNSLILLCYFLSQCTGYCSLVHTASFYQQRHGNNYRYVVYNHKNEHRSFFLSMPHASTSTTKSQMQLGKESSDRMTSSVVPHYPTTDAQNIQQQFATSRIGVITRYIASQALISQNKGSPSSSSSSSSFLSIAFAVDRLETNVQYMALLPRDRSFARLLVTTTERRLGQLDAVLRYCQNIKSKPRRMNALDAFIEAVLRIGAVQILFLHTAPYAAVMETVEVLRQSKDIHVPQSKINYVHAILRRLSNEGIELLTNTTDVSLNASPWLVKAWKETWGDVATNRILNAAMEESPRCLTVNVNQPYNNNNNNNNDCTNQSSRTQEQIAYVASLFDNAEILPQGSIRIVNPPPSMISTWPMYKEGLWWCQDPSATIPAIALYQALSDRGTKSVETMQVIDLCAAPGGKTAQLSNYNFASVTAIEISTKRSKRLVDNMQRLRHIWDIVVADGCDYIPSQLVDGVLVDVPCTATGTGSKRPDVLRRDSDLTELLQIQQSLVRQVADKMIRVGGIIVYATCSLLKQESEDQVTQLLARQDSSIKLETLPFQKGEIPGFDDAIDANGWIRVLPGALEGGLGQCDGFFVARLQRIS